MRGFDFVECHSIYRAVNMAGEPPAQCAGTAAEVKHFAVQSDVRSEQVE